MLTQFSQYDFRNSLKLLVRWTYILVLPFILYKYLPAFNQKENWHIILLFMLLSSVASFSALMTFDSIMTINCGIDLIAVLYYGSWAGMWSVFVETAIISIIYKSRPQSFTINVSQLMITVIITAYLKEKLLKLGINLIVTETILIFVYWLMNLFLCALAIYSLSQISLKAVLKPMIKREGASLYLFIMFSAVITSHLIYRNGFVACIPILLWLYFGRNFRSNASFENAQKLLIKKLSKVKTFEEMKLSVLKSIMELLSLEGIGIIFYKEDVYECLSYGDFPLANYSLRTDLDKYLKENWSSYYAFEINNTSQLIIKHNAARIRMFSGKIDWIQTFIGYLSISIENLGLIDQLAVRLENLVAGESDEEIRNVKWLSDALFHVQEQERHRISADLHDGPMQNILFVKRKINRIAGSHPSEEMQDILDQLDMVNIELRKTCIEIYPQLLTDIGFKGALEVYVSTRIKDTEFNINLDFRSNAIELMSDKAKVHLYRIVQELINNAVKHCDGTDLYFNFDQTADTYLLEYEDNGSGLKEESLNIDNIVMKGMGFRQLKQRIKALDGHMIMRSGDGVGLRVTIEIPIEAESLDITVS